MCCACQVVLIFIYVAKLSLLTTTTARVTINLVNQAKCNVPFSIACVRVHNMAFSIVICQKMCTSVIILYFFKLSNPKIIIIIMHIQLSSDMHKMESLFKYSLKLCQVVIIIVFSSQYSVAKCPS